MQTKPVFHDATRSRWRIIKIVAAVVALLTAAMLAVFFDSLSRKRLLPPFPGITTAIKRTLHPSLGLPRHQKREAQFLAKKERDRLLTQVAKDRRAMEARMKLPPVKGNGIVAAFYAPWQETGLHSLTANASKMTHVLPAWVHLRPDATGLDFHDFDLELTPHNAQVLTVARANNLNIVPVFSNAQQGEFDSDRVHRFLTDPNLQLRIAVQLRSWCVANRFQGINVDFENLMPQDYPLLLPFLQRLRSVFAPVHLVVSVDLEASRPVDWRAVARVCDFVVVMAYDEHASGEKPGPIASMPWYRGVVQRAVRSVPREKLVVGLANYAYDWTEGEDWADPITYQQALLRGQEYRVGEKPETIVDFDPVALNPTFWYVDDENKEHEVWMLDAVTAANQWSLAQSFGVHGVAIWVLGSTDPSIWKFIGRDRLNVPPDMRALSRVSYPYDVEFVGEGEILHVDANPTDGTRTLEIDPATGIALDEQYHTFPTSFVIARSGYKPNTIALTIDDGPASPYTAQMLDELKKANVKATFFLIGENAERYPNLLRRIWNEGHEIGNHSFTHPNFGTINTERATLELNATQRVFQSRLGRSTLLFRPPYNADAEPDSKEEVQPIAIASAANYITVGEFLDPQDWYTEKTLPNGRKVKRTAEEMLQSVLAQLGTEKGSSILLHDGGGDRSETVRLIPMLVRELSKRGYRFVTVSELINARRDDVNPVVTGADTLMLANDRVVFEAWYLIEVFLRVSFISAIVLGTLRVLFVSVLAVLGRRKEKRQAFDEAFAPSVSVVIAAYNEAKVIVRTIQGVLANDYAGPLDVMIVDDGSKDGTYDEVVRHFGRDPRVRAIRQENGGKASALNHGIAEVGGSIIIALDADTIFARDTIAKLVRRFADPLVGAVAGNVKVGNRINPLTYWQAIEYITSQNLDRRAYSYINSVSVVPGAVGAWRREAVLQAGGYTTDTMAEDMDLTWRIRRIGWRIETENEAVGYTEAPDSFRALFKQRFRWAFGTLQSLWKHRRALGRYGWFGRVMLPSLWLFQIAFQALSPLIDLEILWTVAGVVGAALDGRMTNDWQPIPQALTSLYLVAFMYAFFFAIELLGAAIAFRLDREDGKMLLWLFWQRFVYRQLMYAVLLKSLMTAASGIRTGWGKLERKGTVDIELATDELAATTE